jgi:hypothetical protein
MGAKIVFQSKNDVLARLEHAKKKYTHALIEYERVRSNKNYWMRMIDQLQIKLKHWDEIKNNRNEIVIETPKEIQDGI